MTEDNENCFPVLAGNDMLGILAEVEIRVAAALGPGPRPVISALDLEHIQVTDYATLNGVGESQAAAIRTFHKEWPIKSDEMLLLGIRSLIQFGWPEPRNED